ncbi:glycosyltransferase [Virgibacillus halodenitrificans]|uniref:glycosyltransferase n=1 Tax=Virgibacillus halodenitrificans TaxID=1482 RepID=UPI000761941B
MDILYISSACSEQTLKDMSNKYMRGKPLKAPQQTFDLSVAIGMSKYVNVDLISLPPVPSYPNSKCIIFPKKVERYNENVNIKYIPVINLPLVKSLCIVFFTLYKIVVWSKKCKNEKFIVLHWPYFPTMLAAYIAKYFTKNKVILTVPDLPTYSANYNGSSSFKAKLRLSVNKLKPNLINKFEGYVLLTKYMREKLDILDKPYTIMEGLIREENILQNNTLEQKYPVKVIMYAGAVYKKFGLQKLVEAFHKHVNEECELWIYGSGDFVTELNKYEKIDKRIKYMGVKFRDEILEAEKKATLLINPRPSGEDFTRYSFPSKTLEYLGSGTPLLSTKLKGIPLEYYEHLLWIEEETAEGIGEDLNFLLAKGEKWLHEKGKNGQEWVRNNKNTNTQTQKIIDLLKSMVNK